MLPLQGFLLSMTYIYTTREVFNTAIIQPMIKGFIKHWNLTVEKARITGKDNDVRIRDGREKRNTKRPTIGNPTDFRVEASASDYWSGGSGWGMCDWEEESDSSHKSLELLPQDKTPLKAPYHPPRTTETGPLPPAPTYQASRPQNPSFGADLPLTTPSFPLQPPPALHAGDRSTM
jgi:hypothetical protein